jgi:hypothetical protein
VNERGPLPDGPLVLIVIGVEERPIIFSRTANASERRRALDWVKSRHADLLRLALDLGEPRAEVEHEEDTEHEPPGVALLWRSYAGWPMLAPDDLAVVEAGWLNDLGFELDAESRIISWDEARWPWDEDAEPGDPTFRPEGWAPSLAEIEEAEGE